ncbi:MAG TPA: SDR family oxidoreductase [Planctomicrobium sp.]|nr:SDR family oxidoreductase [Planctomicrobium sp.]
MTLANTNVIVTGGAVRIGRAIAIHLAQQGMNVCIHYASSHHEAEETLGLLRGLGVKAVAVQADLRDAVSGAEQVFRSATSELGPVQVLINSAAIFKTGTVLDTSEENWDDHLSLNLKAPFFLSQQFARQLPVGDEGTIINLVDWRGEVPPPGHAAYTIAKAGLIAQTKILAQELGPHIRVNAIAPGAILPPPEGSSEGFHRRGEGIPLQRVGSPDEIVKAVDYLLTARFVTGEILHVTGGEELHAGSRTAPYM